MLIEKIGMNGCLFSSVAQFKYALRQHREDARDHVVRHIGDLVLKFVRRLLISLSALHKRHL